MNGDEAAEREVDRAPERRSGHRWGRRDGSGISAPQGHAATATLAVGCIVVFISVASGTLGTDRALAATVNCGDTITVDTMLEADLIDCPSNGIVIGADDITLDLNGHTVDGNDALVEPCPDNEICDIGILNDGHDDVRIVGGTVNQFGVGVLLFGARRNGVIRLVTGDHVFAGIILAESARSRVRGNTSSGNAGPDSGVGIVLFGSHHNRIARNRVSRNAEIGIHLQGSDDNHIRNNRVRGGREAGIQIVGDGNRIVRNRTVRTGVLITERAVGNVVRGNRVRAAPRGGISVDTRPERTKIEGNHVFRAGAHGIIVGSPTTVLTRNEARNNLRLGIKAVVGVVDGGGNRASGNGDPRQCVNVSCS